MTKFKQKGITSLMHVFITISVFLVAVGLIIGLLCQFLGNGFYAYEGDYTSYQSVTVEYALIDVNGEFSEKSVQDICSKAFSEQGISAYTVTTATTNAGGSITYKFTTATDADKINAGATAIRTELATKIVDSDLTSVSVHKANTVFGNGHALAMGAVALAVAIVLQFIYFVIRYKLTMALAAFLADLHNLVIFLALLAITRIPVASTIGVYAVLTVVFTMAGCAYLFDKMKKTFNSDDNKDKPLYDKIDLCVSEATKPFLVYNILPVICVVVVAALSMIGTLSLSILMSLLCGLMVVVASYYGTAWFTPSVYSRFAKIGEQYKLTHKSKTPKAPKAPKAPKVKKLTQVEE